MSQPAADPQATPTSRAGRDLRAAITVGVVLFVTLVLTLAFFHWGFVLLVAAALAVGAVEVARALEKLGMKAAIEPIVVGTLAIVLGSYLAGQLPVYGLGATTILLATIGLTVLAALIARMPGGADGYVRDAAASLFIIGYLPLMGSFVSLMLAADQGPQRIITFMVCIFASDIGGYAVGVLAGKHPMAPRISPKKSWEGFAGSVFFGVLVGAVAAVTLLNTPWWVGAILGVSMVAFGTCGDLIESLIKRDAGIKDMSSFLPGHGGVMDRLDSLLIGAPAAWLVLYLFVPGG